MLTVSVFFQTLWMVSGFPSYQLLLRTLSSFTWCGLSSLISFFSLRVRQFNDIHYLLRYFQNFSPQHLTLFSPTLRGRRVLVKGNQDFGAACLKIEPPLEEYKSQKDVGVRYINIYDSQNSFRISSKIFVW